MTSRRSFSALLLLGAAVVVLAASEACRAPTQVTLDISYRGGSCGRGVAIVVGEDAHGVEDRVRTKFYAAQTTDCDGAQHVGTLVLTPSSSGAHGAVVVIAGITNDPSTCNPDNGYAGCIVARRAFGFQDHTNLTLPIDLDLACLNVPCSEASSCKNHACVSSEVTCNNDVCGDFGVLPDGGPALEDAPTSNEASNDGGTTGDGSTASDAQSDGPGADAADSGMDAGHSPDGGACTMVSGLCPPYDAGSPCTQGGTMDCAWIAMSNPTCMPPPPPTHLYDQRCTSDRDCPSAMQCCSSGQMALCSKLPCPSGGHLCVENCDCPGTICTYATMTAPPFVKTCSTIFAP